MKYPMGIQSFDRIIEDCYAYIDKADMIYSHAHEGSIYFMSHPHRFGKNLLLVSILKNYFLGRKEPFMTDIYNTFSLQNAFERTGNVFDSTNIS